MKILTKYVLKEHVAPLVFALSALTSLLLLNYIAKQLSNLSGKGLQWNVIAEFLLLSLPFTIAMTLPMAVLVSTLYAFMRLASENEIPAMKANGVSMGSLLFPVAVCGVLLAVGMVAFNDQVLPRANHRLATLMRDIARKRPTFALREQVLNEVLPGRGLTLRTDAIDRTRNAMRNVHIYDISQPNVVRTIHADSGEMYLTTDQRDLVLRLYDGVVVDVDKNQPSHLNRVYFSVNQMRIQGVGNELNRMGDEATKGEREQSICDMTANYEAMRSKLHGEHMEMEARILHLVRQSVAGQDYVYLPPDLQPAAPAQHSWGSVYCSGVTWLGGIVSRVRGESVASDSVGSSYEGLDAPAAPAIDSSLIDTTPNEYNPDLQANPLANNPKYGDIGVAGFAESVSAELDGVRYRMAASKRQMNSFAVEIHKKFSLAGACIVFILLGVPFALRFPRGGVGLVIGASLVIFAVSYVGLIGGEALADRGSLSPFLAMWSANFILAFFGVLLLLRMGRESISRGGSTASIFDNLRYWWGSRGTRENK